jgi:methionyl-tRNA formyltransferase
MFLGAESISEALSILESGNFTLKQQDESQATAAPKVYPETAHITFNKTAQQVHNQIRAMNPHPGSWILWDSKKMKLKDSRTDYRFKKQVEIGSWFLAENELHVQCIDGSVRIGTVQLEGKREQSAFEFLNGYRGEGKIA